MKSCNNCCGNPVTASLAEFLQFRGLNVTCATDNVSSNVLPISVLHQRYDLIYSECCNV